MSTEKLCLPKYHLGLRGFAYTTVPLLMVAAPLFWHHSGNPAFLGFSRTYAVGLFFILFLILLAGLMVGARCQKQGKLDPSFKLLVPLGLLLGGALLIELILRLTAPDSFAEYRAWGHKKSLLFGYVANPNFAWRTRFQNGAWVDYHTDQFGFRVNRHTPNWFDQRATQKTNQPFSAGNPASPLVFTLGESSVFGLGLNDDETWPHLLESKLRNDGRPATVVNAGNNGHNSLQTLLRLYLQVLPHQPNYLLTYLANNDISRQELARDALALDEAVAFTDSMACYARVRNASKNPYCRTLLYYHLSYTLPKRVLSGLLGPEGYDQLKVILNKGGFTRSKSTSWTELKQAWRQVRQMQSEGKKFEPDHAKESEIIAHNGRNYLQNLRTMADICKRNSIRLVPVTFVCDSPRIDSFSRKSIQHYNELVRQFAREEGLVLVDLAQAFSKLGDLEKYFLADHYHPSPTGADKMAELLARAFPEWGQLGNLSPPGFFHLNQVSR